MYYVFAFGFSALACCYVSILSRLSDARLAPLIKYSMFFVVIVFAALASFRTIGYEGGVAYGGIDAHAYKSIYLNVSNQSLSQSFDYQPWEYGYSLLVWICSNIGLSFEMFQFFIYLLLFCTVVEITRRTYAGPASWLCLIAIVIGVVDSFTLLRTYLALFIGVWSFFRFVDGKYKTSLIILAVAVSIHTSSIVFLVMYVFSMIHRRGGRAYLFALLGSVILSAVFAGFFMQGFLSGTRVVGYITADEQYFAVGTYIAVVMIWFSFYFVKKRVGSTDKFLDAAYPMLPSILIILPVHMVHYMAYRMFFPYIMVTYFLIPIALKYLSPVRTGFKVFSTIAYAVVLFYPLSKIFGFIAREYSGELSAQEYQLDWSFFNTLF